MAGIIGAILIGIIITLIEKGLNKDSQSSTTRATPQARPVRASARPPRRKPVVVQEAPVEPSTTSTPTTPFLNYEEEGVRVTTEDTRPMADMPRPAFTKSQQELRRTIILGEILRRKF